MNRRERKAAQSAGITVQNHANPNVVRATISYGAGGAPTTFSISSLQFTRAERTFAADCGIARMRLDSPELHFAQLDPRHDGTILRAVMVRFDVDRFVERAKANEKFRLDLEQKLADLGRRGEPGRRSKLFEQATFKGDTAMTALLDAEAEMISWSGGRAGMVFLAASQNELHSAIQSHAAELLFTPELEVTVTTVVLADMLLSWKTLAGSIS